MDYNNSVVAIFADHDAAEAAVKKLTDAGFEMKHLSVVGKGYHTDEKVVGFYNTGDRIKFWVLRGAFWGGFWGLFFGGLFMTIPLVGHVVCTGISRHRGDLGHRERCPGWRIKRARRRDLQHRCPEGQRDPI